MKVFTSAMIERDFDAPQVFEFARVIDARQFLADAPRIGWTYDEISGELVEAPVRFTVYDESGKNVTSEAVALGWLE